MSKLDWAIASAGFFGLAAFSVSFFRRDKKEDLRIVKKSDAAPGLSGGKQVLMSESGEFFFGPTTFRDRKSAEQFIRQFQAEGDIPHVVGEEEEPLKAVP